VNLGKLELNTEELDLYKLTNQVIDLFIPPGRFKKNKLILNVDKKCTAIYHSRFCQIKTSASKSNRQHALRSLQILGKYDWILVK
jgi:hypothetical protein